jgi:hypothetical protein
MLLDIGNVDTRRAPTRGDVNCAAVVDSELSA